MKANRAVQVSALAGRIMLESGGEVYRVEETADHMCASFGVRESHTYATPTSVIVSATDDAGQVSTAVERTQVRQVDLDKVDAINQLSREFARQAPDVAEAQRRLLEIRGRKPYDYRLVIFFSALACAAFTVVFRGSGADLFPAFAAGALVRVTTLYLGRLRLNDFLVNAAGGALASLAASFFVWLGIGQNESIIAISALMLLVPGLILTNGVRDIAAGDTVSGISRLMEAAFIAIAIACGTAVAYTILSLAGGGPK